MLKLTFAYQRLLHCYNQIIYSQIVYFLLQALFPQSVLPHIPVVILVVAQKSFTPLHTKRARTLAAVARTLAVTMVPRARTLEGPPKAPQIPTILAILSLTTLQGAVTQSAEKLTAAAVVIMVVAQQSFIPKTPPQIVTLAAPRSPVILAILLPTTQVPPTN